MKDRDVFSGCHPAVAFLYFGLVLVFTMFLLNPVCLGISLASAAVYSLFLEGGKAMGKRLFYLVPMAVLAVAVNAGFNHEGATVLAYFPSGNVLTLESLLYGLAAAGLLFAVILWFSCYNAVMTSDKFLYLFGRCIPSLSLVLSMTLRFVPRFQAQLHEIRQAQKCVGRDVSGRGFFRRGKNAVEVLSVLVTWALENAMETADSMKSRGCGLPGRTAFSLYRFDSRDKAVLAWLLSGGFFVFCGWMSGGFAWQYYPSLKGGPVTLLTCCFYFAYLALCLTPVCFHAYEKQTWRKRAENQERK